MLRIELHILKENNLSSFLSITPFLLKFRPGNKKVIKIKAKRFLCC